LKRRLFAPLLWAALAAGCATTTPPAFREGQDLLAQGRLEEGLARLEQAQQESPGDAEIRAYLAKQRERAVNQLLAQGMTAQVNGAYDQANEIYLRAQRIDPPNQRVAAALEGLKAERRHAAMVRDAAELADKGQAEKALVLLRRVLAEAPRNREARTLLRRLEEEQNRKIALAPKLKPKRLTRPITLEFRDASLRAVLEVISRTAGINFVIDKDVAPDLKTTIFVRDTPIEDALKLILLTAQLDLKVLSEHSILVYPNNPAKQRDYQELVMKSFYLANADAKQVGNMLRTMLKTRDVFVDERLNHLMIRDTPEAVRVAEKLIASQDLAEPEAILEVEVLEVSRGRLENLGIQWPTQIGYGVLQGGTTTQSTTGGVVVETTTPGTTVASGVVDLRHNAGGLTTFIANPALLINLNARDNNTNVLANPRIRVKNREKAKIHIGDRVPVLTSTATSTGFVSQSVSYLDVGVKLDVEPNIGLEDEVTMKVGLEVSSIAKEVTSSAGTVAYQVGTRSAGTVLRLRDGETQVLAGLIQDEDRHTASKIPGLGDMPVLGRLFSNNTDNSAKTEIVLLITPRIVRTLAFPPASATEFAAGTESGVGSIGARPGGGGGVSGPLPGATPTPAPAPEPIPAPATGAPTTPGVMPPQPGTEPGLPGTPPAGGQPALPAPLSAL